MNESPDQDITLFTEALRLGAAERSRYLDQACAGLAEQRARIEALLAAYETADDFLVEPAVAFPPENARSVGAMEGPGDRIGRYKLLQQIGEGGYGVVFMAEQEEPVRRRVAVKIVKPGMDTKNVIARFEAERQALALMDHPNIAQVFDAGATESGRPYFVMELVRGVKITDYCDQNSLSTEQRLKLFIQVCSAIQHAHQKGIIHRDIKPSNILVTTEADGKPLPKVIDFGIAKAATGQRLTDKTLFTAFEMLIGTPAYMSPEQAALTSIDVDTRSDIYSLGVLLYELLTSTTPFDTNELLESGLDEVRRVIREQEPARPSTRLSTMMAADLTTVSRRHGAEGPKLVRTVQGDLDWIVMKAMEKDRGRRYPTTNGLAMDIERYLNGEAILARPPSALYKTQKLIAKNKILFFGLALIFVLLAGGLAVTLRLLLVEKQAQQKAQYHAEISQLEGAGLNLYLQGNLAESDQSFRRAFAIRRQYLPGESALPITITAFIKVLDMEQKTNDENQLLMEVLEPRLLPRPEFSSLFNYRLQILVRLGDWHDACQLAAALVEQQPDNSDLNHALAPLLVITGDLPAYHRLCQQIIRHFGATTDPYTADRMAKDCLIVPSPGMDFRPVAAMADVAVTKGAKLPAYPYFKCCKAMAEYRQDHFNDAIHWAQSATNESFPDCNAEALATLALAEFKNGQTNDAVATLARCDQVIAEKLPKIDSRDAGDHWRDWIIAHALRDEAKKLIASDDSSFSSTLKK